MSKKERVGIIGLGIIGSRVAENLRKNGHEVYVWNRSPRPVPNFLGSAEEVAKACPILQFYVSDDDALLQSVQAVSRVITKKHVLLFHPTVSPETIKKVGGIVESIGAQYLEAPFTGSKDAAEKGLLVYYVGGNPALIDQMKPLLLDSGRAVVRIGKPGQAAAVKIAMNMMIAANLQSLAESLAVATAAGVNPEKFREALSLNGANSGLLEMKLPTILAGDFAPHFAVRHMLKDLRHGKSLSQPSGISTPSVDAAYASLERAEAAGKLDDDFSILTQFTNK